MRSTSHTDVCLPHILHFSQETVWLHHSALRCAALTAWSCTWPSGGQVLVSVCSLGNRWCASCGPGSGTLSRPNEWVKAAHPCSDTTHKTSVSRPIPRPCPHVARHLPQQLVFTGAKGKWERFRDLSRGHSGPRLHRGAPGDDLAQYSSRWEVRI